MYLHSVTDIPAHLLNNQYFDVSHTYARVIQCVFSPAFTTENLDGELNMLYASMDIVSIVHSPLALELNATRVVSSTHNLPALQQNAARDFKQIVPEPVVVEAVLEEKTVRALLDTGSLVDFVSTKAIHQLGIQTFELAKQLLVHLAIQGLRAKISLGCKAWFSYQGINESQYFDVVNLLHYDLCEQNANTEKLTSPLPDMEGILRRVAQKPYRSSMDGKDAYGCICVCEDHVERIAMTTPDGNMVSLVLQQRDCNAVVTYQSLMNHLFGPYIGVFMDVYLDDIIIYLDTLDNHIKHVKCVIDILRCEKLYLNAEKLWFLALEPKILRQIVDNNGI
jgi:hypothetical protein